ncbi:MAG: YajG family lipoprotein [Gammaproteobacteria bacterium]
MLKQFGVMLLGIALIPACALSPQEIDVLPVIDVDENQIGRGQRVFLRVADSRKDLSFGARGGVYPETSFIKPRGDLNVAVRNAVSGVLRRYGFHLAAKAEGAAVKFTVDIETIRYLPSGNPVVRYVDTESSFNALCSNGANRFESRYQARLGKDVLTPPSAEENESLINAVLSKGLQAMMSDQGLLDCLSGRAR